MQYRKLTDLKKLAGNPRIIRDKQFKTLCDSIRDNPKYFEARPLILSDRTRDLVIIAGNQRFEAAKTLGLKEAPTFLMEGLTEEKEREIVIRDNISNGEWDMTILRGSWADLPLLDWGITVPDAVDLKEEITTEEEWAASSKTADEAIEAMTTKIRKIAGDNPKQMGGSIAVIINNGRGNACLFLADPNTADIVKELKRLADAGEHSPLETLVRSLL
ncbi:MAG: ParB N-terminal domain-containing protein [Pseudomonadota bacterium]